MDAYRKLCTQFYDLDKPEPDPASYALFRRLAAEANGPILEPMCGSGRFLAPLRREGFEVDGFDASPDMIEACTARGCHGHVRVGTFDDLTAEGHYALAIIPAGSLMLLNAEDSRTALMRIHRALLPGGRLALIVETAVEKDSHDWPWGGRYVERPDGAKILCSYTGRYDAATKTAHNIGRYELIVDGRLVDTEFETLQIRSYTTEEFSALATEAGFVVESIDPQPDNEALFVLRKPS